MLSIIVSSGNIYWNYENDFATFNHTISNANLKNIFLNYKSVFRFLSSQLLVYGPILLLLYIFIVFQSFYKNNKLSLLAMLSFPIILLITIQSFLKVANANWAVTAYIAVTILLSTFIINNKSKSIRLIFKIGLLINITISIFILNVTATASFYPINLKSNPLRKNLGFEPLAKQISIIFQKRHLSSIIFENRSDIARFNYYLNRSSNKFKNKIFLISQSNNPGNYYEANHNFDAQLFDIGDKVLIVSQNNKKPNIRSLSDFSLLQNLSIETIDTNERKYYLYIANIIKK